MKILIACEFSQVVTEQFIKIDQCHEVISCDLDPGEKNYSHYRGDVRDLFHQRWDLIIAFPPCTHLSSSGARWFPGKIADGRQQQGIDFFMEMINSPAERVCVENPVGIMSTKYRKPDQYIEPYWFGEPYTKKTGLWLKNLPPLLPTDMVDPVLGTKMSTQKGSEKILGWNTPEIKKFRSRLPEGIARAMSEQWGYL